MTKKEIITSIVFALLIAAMVWALVVFVCWALYELKIITDVDQDVVISYDSYNCPPVLNQEECYRRIELAVNNGLDVEDYLLSVYNRLK